ncbi:serine hydrolase [Pedobacter sp. Leaf250]|uniref:serine hydrolase domain-containing protein n=1 Tax=Pedobacter sp. Leaf250 TaxID=2876559 RepID=UPI001E2D4A02|nr:serine hydrolase domain-containing protein [Pedobacter sp. Leaf250]
MKNIFKTSIIILLLLNSYLSIAQMNDRNEKIHLLDSVYQALYASGSFNGNVLIAEKGKVVFKKSYGFADAVTQEKLNLQTVFELASVSKQFTAMGIVLLKKRGQLNYDDPISKYLPELNFYDGVTIRNLLNHTSGVPDYIYVDVFREKWDKTKIATNVEVITEFAKYKPPLEFQPGEKSQYSNTGYALLASIIERVSKQTYERFLKENIFRPLHMKHTFIYQCVYAPEKIKNYAQAYGTDSLLNYISAYHSIENKLTTYNYLDGVVGARTVHSNLEDLLKWDRALYMDKLINPEDKKEIFGSLKTRNGKENSYGFGWVLSQNEKYGKIVNHSGSWAGYITYIERHTDSDKTIILLQNVNTPNSKIALGDIRKIMYGIKLPINKKIFPNQEDLDKYEGIYSGSDYPKKIVVFKKGNRLAAHYAGSPVSAFSMDAYPNHTFKCEPWDVEMVFNPDDNSLLVMEDEKQNTLKKQK